MDEKLKSKLITSVKRLAQEYQGFSIKAPQPYIGASFIDKNITKQFELYLKKIDDCYLIRIFSEKNLDQNSFYRALGFAYLEQLVIELGKKKPFNNMFRLITKLKQKKKLQFVSPQSIKNSYNPEDLLELDELPSYFLDSLMRLSEKMWLMNEEDPKEFREKMIKELENLFKTDMAFHLAVLLLLRTEAFEYCETKQIYPECEHNLLDFCTSPSQNTIKLIAKMLKMKIEVYDFDQEDLKLQCINAEPKKIDSELQTVILFKLKGVHHIGYGNAKYCKKMFPKVYQANKDEKNQICGICYQNPGKPFEGSKCKDNYCLECLRKTIGTSERNVIRCNKCNETLGNKGHLMNSSLIRIDKEDENK